MAFHAGRDIAVFGMVTGAAAHLGMGAGELLQLTGRSGMAVGALTGQQVIHRHVERGMGNDMAAHAVEKLGTMGRLGMALIALRHDFLPVVLNRIVAMELLVAVLAVDAMTAAIIFDLIKDRNMALRALDHRERLRCLVIQSSPF